MMLKIPPPVQGLLTALLIWMLHQVLPAPAIPFAAQRTIAVVLFLVGLGIDLVSVFAFFKAKTTVNPLSPQKTSSLVISGLFSFSRNPMYLGMLLMLSGWAVWLGSYVGIVPLCLFIFAINELQIKPEEAVLLEKFGDEYERYKKSVRRWV